MLNEPRPHLQDLACSQETMHREHVEYADHGSAKIWLL